MAQIVKLRRSSVPGQKPTNANLQLGELALNTTDGKVYMAKSGSLGPSVEELISTNTVNTGSINITGDITGSIFTGSFKGDGSGLYNLPIQNINTASLATTGSNVFVGDQIITGSINITGTVDGVDISQFSSSVNSRLNSVTASSGGVSAIYIADEGSIQGTASYFDFIGAGISAAVNNGTASITVTATGGGGSAVQGASQTYPQTTNAVTWSIDHSINSRTPVVEIYDENYNVIIPTGIYNPGAFQTLVYFDVAQRGYAIISTGGGLTVDGANAILNQSSASSTWTFNHNLGTKYPVFNIFDSNDDIIIPQRINVVDENTAIIYFSSTRTGKAVASVGGDVVNSDSSSFSVSSSFATNANLLDGLDSLAFLQTGSFQSYTSSFSSSVATTTSGLTSTITSLSSSLTSSIGSLSSSIATTTSGLSSSIESLSSSVAITTSGLTSTITSLSSSLTSSIGSLSSSIASINNTQNGRLDSLETESGSIRSNFNTFTSSYTTGAFTGSFKGDGSQLYNIPASGVTGLNLNKIISGSVSASISPDRGLEINTNVYIDGSLTAKELFISYVTSSVLYQSGSTKFGDTSDDNHLFTGSVLVDGKVNASSLTGSINFNNLTNVPSLVSGSSQIDITGTTGYSTFSSSISTSIGSLSSSVATTTSGLSSSIGSLSSSVSTSIGSLSSSVATTTLDLKNRVDSIEGITGSISSLNSFTSSINTTIKSKLDSDGVISGSSQIIYSGLTGIPSGIVSGSSQISYTGITNIPSGIVSGSEQLTGSYDTRYVLSGSITQTTWDNIANKPSGLVSGSSQVVYSGLTGIPSGIVSGSSQLTSSYDTRYVLSGSITQTTWDNIASKPSGIVSGSSQIIGLGFATTGSYLTTGSNSLVGNQNINGNLSVTGSVVISGSLDLSNANVGNSRYLHTQGSSSTTWNIVHNLNYLYPNITVYDGDDKIMLPDEVTSIDLNTTQVTFAIAESGHALASVGGISPNAADRYLHTQTSATGSWVIDHNIGYKYVTVNVYDNNDEQLVPLKISAVSANRTQIDFSLPTSGNATITVGGPRVTTTSLFSQTGSYYNATTNIGITGSLVVTGDVDADNFNTTSDRKLKTNLVRIEGALDKIEKLNGYTFDWLEEYSEDRSRQIGMVADEVYEVQPELISHRNIVLSNKEEKIKLLDYSKVTAILIEAIKELNNKITKLENKKKKK
jgi:hypothetical protein